MIYLDNYMTLYIDQYVINFYLLYRRQCMDMV
jgi:hypothetical protein